MTKTFTIAFAAASFAALAAIVPAQAATRSVDINVQLFADRCAAQGGAFAGADAAFACETPDNVIVCSFLTLNNADCEWQGIEGQVAVNRIIGMQDAVAVDGSDSVAGSVKKGGGFKNDLPIKWK
ncbi:MAG: hypothetical protein WBA73_07540 [Devosia sp.]